MENTPSLAEQLGVPQSLWDVMSPSEKLTRYRTFVGLPHKQRSLGYRPTEAEQAELDAIESPLRRLDRYREMAVAAQ